MDSSDSLATMVAKEATKVVVPIAMDVGARAFCEGIPLDWLEKLIISHHDEYGEFSYAACAADIKKRLIKQASKNLFQKAEP